MYKILSIKTIKAVLVGAAFIVTIPSYSQNLVINEIMAANATFEYDKTNYNFSNWIEIYNPTEVAIKMYGYVLHSSQNDARWTIPSRTIEAKGFYRFWAENAYGTDQALLKLDAEGGYIELLDKTGNVIDKLGFGKQYPDVSFGRYPDGSKNIGFLPTPTPLASNIGPADVRVLPVPVFYQKGGLCKTPVNVTIQVAGAPNAVVRYTLNGSEPTAQSPIYNGNISVSTSTVIRAKTFADGIAPSATASQSYIFPNHTTTLPILCLAVDPKYLNDNTIGILVDGTNGAQGNCTDKYVNWNQKWERASNIEFYEPNGEKTIDQYIGIQVAGACSRANPQKSLTLKAKARYGKDKFNWPGLFPYKKVEKFSQLMLRNSGNDFDGTSFRDDMIQNLNRDYTQLGYQASRSVAVYINAMYWGIMSIREKSDENYVESNYQLKDNEFDFLEKNMEVVVGSNAEYVSLVNFLNSNDLANDKNYQYVASKIDINNYLDYMISEIYANNTDWPGNNISFWKPKMPSGKWQWILKDIDFGFGLWNSGYNNNTLTFALEPNGPDWPNPSWSTLLFRKLMSNQTFKEAFKRRFTQHIATTFNAKRVVAFIDSMQQDIASEIPYHLTRWNLAGVDNWKYQVQLMRDFAINRPAVMSQYLSDFYNGDGVKNISATCQPSAGGGFIMGDGIFATSNSTSTILAGDSFAIQVVPATGYRYVSASIQKGGVNETNMFANNKWKYYADGTLPANNWYSDTYTDDTWTEGESQLGYGDGDEKIVITYGSAPQNKYITSYFRKNFYIEDLSKIDSVKLWALFDDGIAIYLNGKEVRRINLPEGEITTQTLAFMSDDNAIANWQTVDMSNLKVGWNTIAAEVHQTTANSSDLSFDLQLKSYFSDQNSQEETTNSNFNVTINSNLNFVFKFEPIEAVKDVIINELMVNNSLYPNESGDYEGWVELLNTGSSPVNTYELYLSDDSTNLKAWRIPNKNQKPLNANEFALLYTDKKTDNGWNHLPFKLSSNGGVVYLSNQSGDKLTILDKVEYGKIYGNQSYARITDGNLKWMVTPRVSPGSSNLSVGIEQNTNNEVNIYPNPAHHSATLTLPVGNKHIEIWSANGKKIKTIDTNNQDITLDVSSFSTGLYIITITSPNNTTALKLNKY